jgi:hypothetical protein
MAPGTLMAQAVVKSVKDLLFEVAWAAGTVYLLLPIWWWLAASSFAALLGVSVLEALRIAGLTLALPAVIRGRESGRLLMAMAVAVQAVELAVAALLCLWMYRALF